MVSEMNLVPIFDLLTAVYWICTIVGGGLVVMSTLSGDDSDSQVDVDTHVDLDVDMDVEVGAAFDAETGHHVDGALADAGSVAAWFSIRFVVFFMSAFGAVGVVLTHLSDVGGGATFGAALLAGLVMGQGVHQLIRVMRRTSGNSTPTLADYVNQRARVTIAITYPHKGEIVLTVRGAQRYVPAVCKHADRSFPVGAEVGVADYRGGLAEVVSIEEFEFLSEEQEGAES